jgi:hypothetical protein
MKSNQIYTMASFSVIEGAALGGFIGLGAGLVHRINKTSEGLEKEGKIKEGRDFTRAGWKKQGYRYEANSPGLLALNKEFMEQNKREDDIQHSASRGMWKGAAVGGLLGGAARYYLIQRGF